MDHPWYAEIKDWSKLRGAASVIVNMPKAEIRSIVEQIPNEWLDRRLQVLLYRFLLRRQAKLRNIIDNRRGVFVNAK